MRNCDIIDSRGKLEIYANTGMLGIDTDTGPNLLK